MNEGGYSGNQTQSHPNEAAKVRLPAAERKPVTNRSVFIEPTELAAGHEKSQQTRRPLAFAYPLSEPLGQGSINGNIGIEQLRDWAVFLGMGHQFVKLGLVEVGHARLEGQL